MDIYKITVHYYINSPYIIKCSVTVRKDGKKQFSLVLKDLTACYNWIEPRYPGAKTRVIYHGLNGND